MSSKHIPIFLVAVVLGFVYVLTIPQVKPVYATYDPNDPAYSCQCGPTGIDPATIDPATAGTTVIVSLLGIPLPPGSFAPGVTVSVGPGVVCDTCGSATIVVGGGNWGTAYIGGADPANIGEITQFFENLVACGNPCGSVSCPSGLTCGSNTICLPSSCASNPGSCSCTALFQPPSVPPPSCQYISVLPNTTSGGSQVFNAGWSYTLTEVGSGGQPPVVNNWSASCQGTGQLGGNPPPPPSVSGTFLSTSTNPVYWTAPAPIPPARLTSCTINVSGTDALGRTFSCPARTQNWVDGGVPPTPTVAPSPQIISGVAFFDKNGDGRQDPATEKECYTGDITVTATTSDGLTPSRIFITRFRSDASCPQYALPVDDQRNYKVEISGVRAPNFLTGWNNGCIPYTPECFGTTSPFAVPIYLLTPSIPPPTLTPTVTPFTPGNSTATPPGYASPTDPYAYLYPTSTPIPPTPTPQPLVDTLWDATLGRFFPSATPLPAPTSTPVPLPTVTPSSSGRTL